MNKPLFYLLFITQIFHGGYMFAENTKLQNIDNLFYLMNDKSKFEAAMMPVITSLVDQVSFKDEQLKNECKSKTFDKFFENIKKQYIIAYDKTFDESEIQELLNFYMSKTGKKFIGKATELSAGMGNVFASLQEIIQEIAAEANPEIKAETKKVEEHKSEFVTDFASLVKSENDNTEEIFANEIKDGMTVVKFSAKWCPPCKTYAPVFSKIAENNKEITVNDKKVAVKYLAIDVDRFQKVAQNCKIMSIPTTIFFKDGKQVASMTGARDEITVVKKLQELAN
ncbi:thioredoxin domain-containing protein [Candidatus Dependentiae bacterium]|nr:thioredoxin domain-containing protein [Candidatus Dependentiae bacterium]